MFNPDITKLAQEVIFSRKTGKPFNPQVFFNEVPVERSVSQKHLGLHLDQKLDLVIILMKKSHRKEHQSLKNFITFYQKDVLFAI